VLLLLRTAVSGKGTDPLTNLLLKHFLMLIELLAIPGFWFGGPFFTTQILKAMPLNDVLFPYMITLAIVVALAIYRPIVSLTVSVGNDIARGVGS